MFTCRARRYNDEMQCFCGLTWDVNDPERPQCPKKSQGRKARKVYLTELMKIREILNA